MKHVAFRVDASSKIGTGHVMRCATLGRHLRLQGAEVHFICRRMPGDYCNWLENQGFIVHRLPAAQPIVTTVGESATSWLGVPVEQEIAESCAFLVTNAPFDWLVVDHYGLDESWETAMRAYVSKVLVIDDLANRVHNCDVLLDQNYSAEGERRYEGLVTNTCKLLVGPRYALLQPEYATYRKTLRARDEIKRVLVFFGGTDPQNLTGLALEALSHPELLHLGVDVVIGSNNPHREALEKQSRERPKTSIHGSRPHLADLMAQADLAIGAGGATSWERCCLGLPSIVITLAENQRSVANQLAQRGLIQWLGHFDEVDEQAIRNALRAIVEKPLSEKWSQDCWELVDGLGANRVVAAMTVGAETPLIVRLAKINDEKLLLRWANDPVVRSNAFSSELISATTHKNWLKRRLGNPHDYCLYVIETEQVVPIGQVRFERTRDGWKIDYSLDSLFRGRGLGKRILKHAISKLITDIGECVVFGEVKIENFSSRRIFESLGFKARADGKKIIYRCAHIKALEALKI